MNLAELVRDVARRAPHDAAVRMGDAVLEYGDLWDESGRVAAGMAAVGVKRGDRVLLYAENRPEIFVVYLAAARLGAIFAPVHSSFKTMELEYVLRNSGAKILITETQLVGQFRGSTLLPLVPEQVVTFGNSFDELGVAVIARQEIPEGYDILASVEPDSPALISYTSGSTSRTPTPVTRSHGSEIWNAVTYADVWDVRSDDRVLISLPLSWVYGLTTVGLTALSAGATVVLQSARTAEPFLPVVEKYQISVFAGTMTMYSRLLAELQGRSHDHSSLRRLFIGGESVVEPVLRLIQHYTNVRPYQAYATTEVAPVLVIDPVRDAHPPAGTAGRKVEGSEIRLVDSDGHDVLDGEVGEAWLGGRGLMLGYWNEPELTAARVTSEGWYRSGDYMWRDNDGYYFMVGRGEDVIIRAGSKVAVAEVEAAIVDLDGIEDVVVVGIPDEEFGEAVIAFIVFLPGRALSIDSIYDGLGARIARFKLPTEVYVLNEIPLGLTGKRDRHHLRKLAQTRPADRVVVTIKEWQAKRSRGLDE